MASKKQKSSWKPVVIVAVLTVILAGVAVGSRMAADSYTGKMKAELAAQQQQAIDTNNAIYAGYQQELAEFYAKQETGDSGNEAWPTPSGEGWEIIDLSNYPLENAYQVTMTRAETMNNGMLLVNEWHSRPDDFSEYDLVSLSTYSNHAIGVQNASVRLFPTAAQALLELITEAKANGYENYVVYDSYRTWDEQNEKFQKQLEKVRKEHSGYNEERLIELARKSVNYPGTSAYNSGNAFRISLYKRGDAEVNNKKFFECDEGLWFLEHCWEYGIVFRFQLADYPVKGSADKSYKTGVSSQLQTFAYVGKGNAAVMNALDLCMEEYVEYLMQHPHIAVYENGSLKYEITRECVGDEASFPVTIVGSYGIKSYTTSLDNMGYAITVFEY